MIKEIYLSSHDYPNNEACIAIPSGVRMRVIHKGTGAAFRVHCIIEDNAQVEFVAEHTISEPLLIVYEFTLKRDAQLVYKGSLYGSSSADYRLSVACDEPGAHAAIFLGYAVTENAQLTMHTFQHHEAPHTTSTLICKGIAAGQSYVSYDGMIRIEQGAQHVSAGQENKTIIVGPQARAASIPNIEVLANDVQCTHASAIGRHDEDIIEYLRSRGLSEQQATHLLLDAFLSDVISNELNRRPLLELVQ